MYKLIKDDVCDRSGVRRLTYVCDSTEDLYSIGRAPAGSTAFVPSVNAVYTMSPSGAWVFTPDTEWALAEQSDTKPKQVLSKRLSANLSAFTITKAGEEITTGAYLVTGDTLTITVEPNAGYEALCLANGAVLGVSNTSETYTYVVEPGKQVTITAAAAADKAFDLIFRETGCTISVTGPDGEILPGENMILNGTTITITTEADPNRVMSTLTVNGDAFTSGDTLVVNRDVTVEALALELFDITITTDGHCDVVVNGGEYTDGSTAFDRTLISIEAAAHEGYILEEDSITINGTPYTEPFVLEGDTTISASAAELFDIVATANLCQLTITDEDGTSYISGDSIPAGRIVTIAVTPDSGYVEDVLTINGNPYTGSFRVTEDIAIVATVATPEEIIQVVDGGYLMTNYNNPEEGLTLRSRSIPYLNPAYCPFELQDNIYLVINDGNGDIEKRLIYGRLAPLGEGWQPPSYNGYGAYDPLDRYDYSWHPDSTSWPIKFSDDLFVTLTYTQYNESIHFAFHGAKAPTATVVRMYHKLTPVEVEEEEILPVVAGGHLLTMGQPEDLTYRHGYIAYSNPAYSPIDSQDNIYVVINDGNGDIEKRLIYGRIELPGWSGGRNSYAAYDQLDRYDYSTGLQDSQSWTIKISDDLFVTLSYDQYNGWIHVEFNGANATTATVVRMYHKLIPVEITSITTLNCSVAISDGVTVFDVNDSIYAWTPVTVTATAEAGYAIESLLMKVNGGLVVNGHTFVADSNTTGIVITASVQQESSTISLLSGGPISTWVETEVDPEEMPGFTVPIADMTNVDIALSGLVEGRDDINLTYVLNGAPARTVTDLKVSLSEGSDFLSEIGTYSISAKETMDMDGIMLLDAEGNPSIPIMLRFSEDPNGIFEGASTSKPIIFLYAMEQSYKEDIAGAYIKLSTEEYIDPTQATLYSEGYVLDAAGTYVYNGSSYVLLSGITDRYARAEDVAGTHVLDDITGNYRLYNSETDGALQRYNFTLDNSTPGGYILLATDLYGDLTTLSLYSEGFVEDGAGTYIKDGDSYNLVSSYATKYSPCGWSEVNTLSITSINIGKENILNSYLGPTYDSVVRQAWVMTFSLTERVRSATLYELIYTYNDVTTKTIVESIYVDSNQPTGTLALLEPSFRGTVPISTDNETAKIKLGDGLYATLEASGADTSPSTLYLYYTGENVPGEQHPEMLPNFQPTALNRITPMPNAIGSPITVDTPFDETWYQANIHNALDDDFLNPNDAEAISVLYTYLGVEYGVRLGKSLLQEYRLSEYGSYVLVADEYVAYENGNPAHEGLDRYQQDTYYTFGTDADNLYIRKREDYYYLLHKLPISEGVTLEVTRLIDADYTAALQIE
jgi:hypothetical protein